MLVGGVGGGLGGVGGGGVGGVVGGGVGGGVGAREGPQAPQAQRKSLIAIATKEREGQPHTLTSQAAAARHPRKISLSSQQQPIRIQCFFENIMYWHLRVQAAAARHPRKIPLLIGIDAVHGNGLVRNCIRSRAKSSAWDATSCARPELRPFALSSFAPVARGGYAPNHYFPPAASSNLPASYG